MEVVGIESHFHPLRELQVARGPNLQTQSRKVSKGHFHPLVEEGPPHHYPRCQTARGDRRYLYFFENK